MRVTFPGEAGFVEQDCNGYEGTDGSGASDWQVRLCGSVLDAF
jgi:hypothetical protein